MTKKRNTKRQGGAKAAVGKAIAQNAEGFVLLPPRLLGAVLDCTSQPDVLAVAGVCRAWRTVAREHALYYAYAELDGDTCCSSQQFEECALDFTDTLVGAGQENMRLVVRLSCPLTPYARSGRASGPRRGMLNAEVARCIDALAFVKKAMSRIINLYVSVPRLCTDTALDALSVEAPLLESMYLGFPTVDHVDEHDPPIPFAAGIFASTPPPLKTVHLVGVDVAGHYGAFRHAENLCLEGYPASVLPLIAGAFPAVRELALEYLDVSGPPRAITVESLGSNIRELTLSLTTPHSGLPKHILRLLESESIPRIVLKLQRASYIDQSLERIFHKFRGPVTVTLHAQYDEGTDPAVLHHRPSNRSHETVLEVHYESIGIQRRLSVPTAHESTLLNAVATIANRATEVNIADILLFDFFTTIKELPVVDLLSIDLDCSLRPPWLSTRDLLDALARDGRTAYCPKVRQIFLRCLYWKYNIWVGHQDIASFCKRFPKEIVHSNPRIVPPVTLVGIGLEDWTEDDFNG